MSEQTPYRCAECRLHYSDKARMKGAKRDAVRASAAI